MADVYFKDQAVELLKNQYIVFIGDSNMRAQYKDLVWLLNFNTLIPADTLKRKLVNCYLGDVLIKRSELHRGRNFEEVRSYKDDKLGLQVDYMFITKCYNDNIVNMFQKFKNSRKNPPTVVFMNSCLWDLTRWGADGATQYKENMTKLMYLFKDCLPATTIVIWSTALPVASRITGGLLIKQIEFLKYTLRFDVMEANLFARTLVTSHGYDVIDFHYYLRYQLHRRVADGVHYQPIPVRYMTNLMLTHLALSWGCDLPGRIPNLNFGSIDDANSLTDTVENRYVPPVIPLSKAEKTEHIQSHKRKKRKRRRRNSYASKEQDSNNKKAGPESSNNKKAGPESSNNKKAGPENSNNKKAGHESSNNKKAGPDRTSKRSNSNRYRPY